MRTTSTFAASFEFVVWTIPSLDVSAVWPLHLPPRGGLARDWHSSDESSLEGFISLGGAFPEFDRFYYHPPRIRQVVEVEGEKLQQQPIEASHAKSSTRLSREPV
ncbi:MAG: hypothetical protein KDA80_18545 [Planctomycetaceae bacterium]|nr:hypothetical protein [Planctomycetaceae bacterium]